jgi:carbamoyl-phosphate synthase/aspartate carbamoyltransferase
MGFAPPRGQTMLKIGSKRNDLFATLSVQAFGTQIETIDTMEGRQLFAAVMEQIGEKCVQSMTPTTTEVGDWNIQLRTQSHLT